MQTIPFTMRTDTGPEAHDTECRCRQDTGPRGGKIQSCDADHTISARQADAGFGADGTGYWLRVIPNSLADFSGF